MPTTIPYTEQLIADAYRAYRDSGIKYIFSKIGNNKQAEDLVQDAFVRLMEYRQMLREDTVKAMFFTVLRNLLYDYLRRFYKQQEITAYLYDHTINHTDEPESTIVAEDLETLEKKKLNELPTKRRMVYMLSRYEDKTIVDIAEEMGIALRTAENHLRMGRKEVREYIRQCI